MNVSCREVPASQAVTFVSKLSIRPQITTSPFYISLASPTPPTGSALPYRAQRALHQRYQHEEHPSLELLITTRKRYFVSCSCSRAYEGGKVTSTGHSSDQYWSQREVVVVAISYQYWSRRRPVLVRIPPLLGGVVAFPYVALASTPLCPASPPLGSRVPSASALNLRDMQLTLYLWAQYLYYVPGRKQQISKLG